MLVTKTALHNEFVVSFFCPVTLTNNVCLLRYSVKNHFAPKETHLHSGTLRNEGGFPLGALIFFSQSGR